MKNSGKIFEKLLQIAKENGIRVLLVKLAYNYARIKGDRIAIDCGMPIDDINYNLAHELAHFYLHYDKGDILNNDGSYEEQADRAAKMLLAAAEIWEGGAEA